MRSPTGSTRRGFAVRVWNRTRRRTTAIVAAGATAAQTPAEAVAEADVVRRCSPTAWPPARIARPAGSARSDAARDARDPDGHYRSDLTDLLAAVPRRRRRLRRRAGWAAVTIARTATCSCWHRADAVRGWSHRCSTRSAAEPCTGEAGAEAAGSSLNNWLACMVEGLAETWR
jgi:hypothetical protein